MVARVLKLSFLVGGLLISLGASAFQVNGLIKPGEPIKWIDEDSSDTTIKVPWHRAVDVNEDGDSQFCVGGGGSDIPNTSYHPQNLTLRGPSGNNATLRIHYVAAEWKFAQTPTSTFKNPTSSLAGQATTLLGNIAHIENTGPHILGDICFKFASGGRHLEYFRPVIEIDPDSLAALSEKFDTGELPNGSYVGNAYFPASYSQRDNWGNVYYHIALGAPVEFIIQSENDRIAKITVVGDDVIIPDTVTEPGKVQGSTNYKTTVEGVVSNGVKVSLLKPNSDFSLKPMMTAESETNKIPYSVFCRECEGSGVRMIENGKAISTSSHYSLLHNDFLKVEANFEVSFAHKPLDELYNDTYIGSFTLLFELDL
ncbi:hypothetical protein DR996_00445 [Vibrio owensii]|nr:hypothetical protein DR996_00445 [Vibrio owensii]